MQTKTLNSFLAAARTLNFGEAARLLNYSQSTVSEQIKALEDELGVQLFERIGRKVFLTEEGTRLMPLADNMVREEENIKTVFSRREVMGGSIRIAVSETLSSYWLPALLKEYRQKYPCVEFHIYVGDCSRFPQLLQQNLADVAFSQHEEDHLPQMHRVFLFSWKSVFIVAPDHPLAHKKELCFRDFDHQALLLPVGEAGYPRTVRDLLKKHRIETRTVMESGSVEVIKQFIKCGLGISILPEIAVRSELESGVLVGLRSRDMDIPIRASMLFHQDKWASPQLAALEQMVCRRIAEDTHL